MDIHHLFRNMSSMFNYYLGDYPSVFPAVSNDVPGFEEMLALAAEHFPLNDGKSMGDGESYATSAPSPFTSSSGSSSAMSPPCHESDKGSDAESDTDIEPLCLDGTYHITDQPPRVQSLYVHSLQLLYSCIFMFSQTQFR